MTERVLFDELETETKHRIGVITLNAEKSLNALDQEMVDALYDRLSSWQSDDKIVCVFMQGAGGKAFCSGGDVRALRENTVNGDLEAPRRFFEKEYRLDYLIHTYAKPVICWGHGVIMGGGIGLMSGASFRVVTDTSTMAMPEITIGLYPDVGASWVLGKLPARTGLFMALTGCRLNAADAVYLGLANRFIDHAFRTNVLEALQAADWSQDHYTATYQVVKHYADNSAGWLPYSKIREHRDLICRMMDQPSLELTLSELEALSTDDEWLNTARSIALSGSPLSAAIAREQLYRSRHYSLKEAFQSELILSVNCALKGDFNEGVRALLVDKDKQPVWKYGSASQISSEALGAMFESPWSDHPLSDL